MLKELQLNWEHLLRTFAVDQPIAKKVFLDLVNLYSTPNRYYHNLRHIQQVLEIIKDLQAEVQNLAAIEFAAWFHDVIYDSTAKDNEEKSSEYAEIALKQLEVSEQIISATKQLILTTKKHQALENDIDSQILLDADMSILGANDYDYRKYAKAIRKEYDWLSEEQYRLGRKNFLRQVLQRQRIYSATQIFNKLEVKARENIYKEITFLSK